MPSGGKKSASPAKGADPDMIMLENQALNAKVDELNTTVDELKDELKDFMAKELKDFMAKMATHMGTTTTVNGNNNTNVAMNFLNFVKNGVL